MERQTYQTYCGSEGQGCGVRIVERCRECRGRLVQSGEELACVNCGVVARTEQIASQIEEITTTRRPSHDDERLGSYMGTKEEAKSHASFNGNSTVGYVKRLSDHMGEDHKAWSCSALINRVAEQLALPEGVKENAILLSRKILADRHQVMPGRKRPLPTIPTISAYSLLSACRRGGVHRVSTKTILEAYARLNHKVTRSSLLQLGTQTRVPLGTPDIEGLMATAIKGLQSSPTVAERLERHRVEGREYFAKLMDRSKVVANQVRAAGRGISPRTMAAGSVYMAALQLPSKVFTQEEAAETLGVAEYTVRDFTGWARHQFGPAAKRGRRSLKGGQPS